MFKYDVLCIGSATMDQFLTTKQELSKIHLGDKILVKHKEIHSGGGGTNTAAALSKLGLKVKLLTKLGNDQDADLIAKEMKDYGVKLVSKKRSRKTTDSSIIMSSVHGKDRIVYVNKAASRELSHLDYTKSQLKVKWIYMASLVGKSLRTGRKIAEYAYEKKIPMLFNPSLYLAEQGLKNLKPLLKAAKILILNKEEAQALTKSKRHQKELLGIIQKSGPEIVIITDGPKKLYAANNDKAYWMMPPKVKVVQTLGAGDAFNSGFLAGIIKKYSFEDALRLGQVNSSSVIQYVGTKNKLLTEKEAKEAIKKHRIKVVLFS